MPAGRGLRQGRVLASLAVLGPDERERRGGRRCRRALRAVAARGRRFAPVIGRGKLRWGFLVTEKGGGDSVHEALADAVDPAPAGPLTVPIEGR